MGWETIFDFYQKWVDRNFSIIAKLWHSENFAGIAKISLCRSEIHCSPSWILRLRAPSHEDLSTTNSSGFTPDFE